MERLKHMKETLMTAVESQLGNLNEVNAEELGEVVDMVKDLSEAIYYCTITKEMEECKEEKEHMDKYKKYFKDSYPYPPVMYGEGQYENGRRMYYTDDSSYNTSIKGNNARGGGSRGYHDGEYYPYPSEIRDFREGKSPITRRNYMESKELHKSKEKQMQELEKYMKELTDDVLEMISDASPEEKSILSQKLNMLAERIN